MEMKTRNKKNVKRKWNQNVYEMKRTEKNPVFWYTFCPHYAYGTKKETFGARESEIQKARSTHKKKKKRENILLWYKENV